MSSSEYLRIVEDFLDTRKWKTSTKTVREGVYILLGRKKTDSGPSKILGMVVDDPETEVTNNHLKYLLKSGREQNADRIILTSRVQISNAIQQTAQDNGITVIDSDTVISQTNSQIEGPSTGDDTSTGDEESNQDEAYEIYASRTRTALYGFGGLLLSFGSLWMLSGGFSNGLIVSSVLILMIPLGFGGGLLLLHQTVKNEPVIQITNSGIHYSKSLGTSEFYRWENIERISRAEQKIKRTKTTFLKIEVSESDDDESSISQIETQLNKVAIGDDDDAHYIPIDSYGISFAEVSEAITQSSDIPVSGESNI